MGVGLISQLDAVRGLNVADLFSTIRNNLGDLFDCWQAGIRAFELPALSSQDSLLDLGLEVLSDFDAGV